MTILSIHVTTADFKVINTYRDPRLVFGRFSPMILTTDPGADSVLMAISHYARMRACPVCERLFTIYRRRHGRKDRKTVNVVGAQRWWWAEVEASK